jgi:hypothetical protein
LQIAFNVHPVEILQAHSSFLFVTTFREPIMNDLPTCWQ